MWNIETQLDDMKQSYDWHESADMGGEKHEEFYNGVKEVLASSEGEEGVFSRVAVFKMKDGLFTVLAGWREYNERDSPRGVDINEVTSLDFAIKFLLTDEERRRLNITLDEIEKV